MICDFVSNSFLLAMLAPISVVPRRALLLFLLILPSPPLLLQVLLLLLDQIRAMTDIHFFLLYMISDFSDSRVIQLAKMIMITDESISHAQMIKTASYGEKQRLFSVRHSFPLCSPILCHLLSVFFHDFVHPCCLSVLRFLLIVSHYLFFPLDLCRRISALFCFFILS